MLPSGLVKSATGIRPKSGRVGGNGPACAGGGATTRAATTAAAAIPIRATSPRAAMPAPPRSRPMAATVAPARVLVNGCVPWLRAGRRADASGRVSSRGVPCVRPAPTRHDGHHMTAAPTLVELMPASPDEDALYDAFSAWTLGQGLTMYPAQQDAVLELLTGANVILATPTGSGKSLVAIGGALHRARRRSAQLLHRADQGAGVGEVLRPLRHLRRRPGRHAHRRRQRQPRCARSSRCTAEVLANIALRSGREADIGLVVMDEFHFYADPDRGWAWQVPLLELPAGAVPAPVGHPRRRQLLHARPDVAQRPADHRGEHRRATGTALLLRTSSPRCTRRSRTCWPGGRRRSTSCTSPRNPRSSERRRS